MVSLKKVPSFTLFNMSARARIIQKNAKIVAPNPPPFRYKRNSREIAILGKMRLELLSGAYPYEQRYTKWTKGYNFRL